MLLGRTGIYQFARRQFQEILLVSASVQQVGFQSLSAGVSRQVRLLQSPPPITGPDIQPFRYASTRPSLSSSDVMGTGLLFNDPIRAPSG